MTMMPRRRETISAAPERAPGKLGVSAWSWVLREMSLAWREAQVEASRAYRDWCGFRGPIGYAIYRAAQDRADACQDALSERYAYESGATAR
jgi:hypothetical protein